MTGFTGLFMWQRLGNGKPLYGVWFVPDDEPDVPVIVGDEILF